MRRHIVHVHEKFYPFLGGSTHRLLNLLLKVNFSKYKITVICENSENVSDVEKYKGINIIRFNSYIEIPNILNKVNKEEKIDLIHSHNFRPTFYCYFSAKFKLKVPFIMEMHSIYKTGKIKEFFGKFFLNHSDKIIVLSESSKTMLLEKFKIKDKGNIHIIYNGINLHSYNNYQENYSLIENSHLKNYLQSVKNNGQILVSYIGSLDYFQGIDNLIDIINNTNNSRISFLVVGGDKEECSSLKEKIINPKCLVNPYIPAEFVKNLYLESNILIVPRPSLLSTESAIPLKPLEALVNNTVVFSTKVGGMLELQKLTNSKNIYFFEEIKGIIEYLNKLTEPMPYCKSKIQELNYFDVNFQSDNLIQIYDELINGDTYARK